MPDLVHITPVASKDIDETIAWRKQRSPAAAARWHAALLKKVDSLEDDADRYPRAAEAADLGIDLREMLFGKRRGIFRVLFTLEANRVLVHHVRRASRDSVKPDDLP